MLRALAAVAASGLLLGLPTAAEAKTLRGKTSQRRAVTLTLGADGVPTGVRIRWRAPCTHKPGTHTPGTTTSSPPFDQATADLLRDGGTYRQRYDGGISARITGDLSGHRSGAGWKGTFAVRKVFLRKGKVIDRCEAKRIRWSVR
jgi:hypothetical protein